MDIREQWSFGQGALGRLRDRPAESGKRGQAGTREGTMSGGNQLLVRAAKVLLLGRVCVAQAWGRECLSQSTLPAHQPTLPGSVLPVVLWEKIRVEPPASAHCSSLPSCCLRRETPDFCRLSQHFFLK